MTLSDEFEKQIQRFLTALDEPHRELFMNYVENTYSPTEIWLYARVLGYEGAFAALEQWIAQRFPKLNRVQVLVGETNLLEKDIAYLRQMVKMDVVSAHDAANKIGTLSKEIRGHVSEIDKMTKSSDRRGLLMAGADRALREIKGIFKGNDEMTNALALAEVAVWDSLKDES